MLSVHPLQAIAEGAPAVGVNLSTPTALTVGHIDHVPDMLNVFANTSEGSGKVALLATLQELTPAEFKALCTKSVKAAAKIDKLGGFVASDTAKGAEKYGPKELSIRSQTSQAMRVWGALKQGAPNMPPGFKAAVTASREFLAAIARTWDGNVALTDDQKEAAEARSIDAQAYAAAVEADPTAQLADLAPIIKVKRAELVEASIDDEAVRMCKGWIKAKVDIAIIDRALALYVEHIEAPKA